MSPTRVCRGPSSYKGPSSHEDASRRGSILGLLQRCRSLLPVKHKGFSASRVVDVLLHQSRQGMLGRIVYRDQVLRVAAIGQLLQAVDRHGSILWQKAAR